MKTTSFKRQNDMDEILFENRNRAYGAYQLRTSYEFNLWRAYLMAMFSLLILGLCLRYNPFGGKGKTSAPPLTIVKPVVFENIKLILPKELHSMGQAQKVVPRTPKKEKTSPVVKPDDKLNKKEPEKKEDPKNSDETNTSAGTSSAQISATDTRSGAGSTQGMGTDSLPGASEDKAVLMPDVLPEFPGGFEAMQEFIRRNLHVKSAAYRASGSVRIVVSFVVDPEGKLSHIEPLSKNGFGMEEAVMDLVKEMPRWKPGKNGKREVYVKMVLPVHYELR